MSTQEHEAAAEKSADEAVTWTAGYRNYSRALLVKLIAAALADAVRVARADEREACAKVAEESWGSPRRFGITQAKATARLIRTRAGEGDATAKDTGRELLKEIFDPSPTVCPRFAQSEVAVDTCLHCGWTEGEHREGDAMPGPVPACSWCGMVGVQHVDPCEATPPKKGTGR